MAATWSCKVTCRQSNGPHSDSPTLSQRSIGKEGKSMKIGFIGTGTMGQPMLGNLVKKGFQVVAYDVVAAALDSAARLGAAPARSIGEAVADCDLVVTMLPSSANVEAVY